ncbi:MAG: TetR/AcrR family transcriptional regulator C-terminal domain-containing protein [Leptospiraceae bacterium]|nr:TetR/AcrR family transcriptional regulator C-terminal domain-containing protein [Leptospiraceae bacterium]
MQLADQQGIGALSMRKLAAALGVEAMSLYHHVKSRENLLDQMVDRVFAALSEQSDNKSGEWQPWIMEAATHMRSVLRKHPWSVGLLDSRRNPGSATLGYQNARLGRLREAGFSLSMAAHAVAVLDSFVYGFVLQEIALPFENGTDLETLVQDIESSMPAGEYPYLVEMMQHLVLQQDYSFAREFAFGLNVLITGLGVPSDKDQSNCL